jgi:diaminopimelate epimerase
MVLDVCKICLSQRNSKKEVINIETGDGVKIAYLDLKDDVVNGITIDMGKYSYKPEDFGEMQKKKL